MLTCNEVLPDGFDERLVSSDALVVRWMETRSEAELEIYPHLAAPARGVISEAFSSRVITPGVTTTDDVAWFIRKRFELKGLPIWFMPYANVQRPGEECTEESDFCGIEGNIAIPIESWDGQHVQIKLEQTAWFNDERVIYAAGQQTEWHVVR